MMYKWNPWRDMECTEVFAMFYFINMNRSDCICFKNKAKFTWILDNK